MCLGGKGDYKTSGWLASSELASMSAMRARRVIMGSKTPGERQKMQRDAVGVCSPSGPSGSSQRGDNTVDAGGLFCLGMPRRSLSHY